MELILNLKDSQFQIVVPPNSAQLLEQQLERISTPESQEAFTNALLLHLTRVLGTFLDPDLRPPTEKQVTFAMAVSKRAKVPIPREALMYRYSMCDFLDKYVNKRD
jgi:hypothetical protein